MEIVLHSFDTGRGTDFKWIALSENFFVEEIRRYTLKFSSPSPRKMEQWNIFFKNLSLNPYISMAYLDDIITVHINSKMLSCVLKCSIANQKRYKTCPQPLALVTVTMYPHSKL